MSMAERLDRLLVGFLCLISQVEIVQFVRVGKLLKR
jgi:hypothetical protein